MRHLIGTAPKNRNVVIIEDDASGSGDVARRSPDVCKVAPDDIKADARAPSQTRPVWRRRIVFSIVLVLVVAALWVHYAYPRGAPWAHAISQHFSEKVITWLGRKVHPSSSQRQAESDRTNQSLERAAKEPAAHAIGGPKDEARRENSTKQPPEVTAPPLPGQELENPAALMQDVQAVRQALAAMMERALEEHTRSDKLADEHAAARRELEAKAVISSKTGDELIKLKEMSEAEEAKLGRSLQQERDHGTALANDLAAVRKELETKEALLSKAVDELAGLKAAGKVEAATAAGLAQSLEQERDHSAALTGELASAHRDLAARTVLSNTAGDELTKLKGALEAEAAKLQQERDHGSALANDLAAVRKELETREALLRKAGDELARLKEAAKTAAVMAAESAQSLQQEREARLREASEASRREVTTKAAISSKTGDELTKLKEASEAEAAKLGRSLQQERDHGTELAADLAMVRKELETKQALLSKAGEELAGLREAAKTEAVTAAESARSLKQERDHSASLTGELASAHREVAAKTTLLSTAGDAEARLRAASEAKVAELVQSLQRERDNAAAFARELESAQQTIETRAKPNRTASGQTENAMTSAAAAVPSVVAAIKDNREVARLMAHASSLLAQGNIGAGRTFLERAIEAGSAEASFALAETYDPHVLSRWGTYGTRGDASKARELYGKAVTAGILEARDRFNALRE